MASFSTKLLHFQTSDCYDNGIEGGCTMKKLLSFALLLVGLSINAGDHLSYTLKNDSNEPVTFILRFRAKHIAKGEGMLMDRWQHTIEPGKSHLVKHDKMDEMSLTVQKGRRKMHKNGMIHFDEGDIIIDNIKPENGKTFTILPNDTLEISR
jgi:hypothetical protein